MMTNDRNNPFQISTGSAPITSGRPTHELTGSDLKEKIENLINTNQVFLFMKGTPAMPMCGFSANTCAILNNLGVEYKTFNILESDEIRQGVKEYSNWPTYPQLYFKGKLLGGNDIITEMYQSGELQSFLKEN